MRIVQENKKCIGCGACVALCPEFWETKEDGKAYPKNGKQNPETGNYELEAKEAGCNKEAAASCPVEIIHIIE